VKLWWDSLEDIQGGEPKGELDFFGHDYGRPVPMFLDYDRMILCDISLPKDEMESHAKRLGKNFVWIDHHISAIKENEGLDCAGLRQTDRAACELTWLYLFKEEHTMPVTVLLLGVYDSWRNKDQNFWDETVIPFQYGMRLKCNSFETFPHEMLLRINSTEAVVSVGKILLAYQKQQDVFACRASFERTFKGLRAICLNSGGMNSNTFLSVWNEDKYDLMISFFYNGHQDFFNVSLYSTKSNVDCSVLAKEMGGGGHKGAAGFQVPDFKAIFDK
jgi:oligoribonuclease NrnB/cAMP/cGMP phosphodiesterase (DHH superfamily)